MISGVDAVAVEINGGDANFPGGEIIERVAVSHMDDVIRGHVEAAADFAVDVGMLFCSAEVGHRGEDMLEQGIEANGIHLDVDELPGCVGCNDEVIAVVESLHDAGHLGIYPEQVDVAGE